MSLPGVVNACDCASNADIADLETSFSGAFRCSLLYNSHAQVLRSLKISCETDLPISMQRFVSDWKAVKLGPPLVGKSSEGFHHADQRVRCESEEDASQLRHYTTCWLKIFNEFCAQGAARKSVAKQQERLVSVIELLRRSDLNLVLRHDDVFYEEVRANVVRRSHTSRLIVTKADLDEVAPRPSKLLLARYLNAKSDACLADFNSYTETNTSAKPERKTHARVNMAIDWPLVLILLWSVRPSS